jgi:broad specificity phosphatase PhoE
MPCIKATLTRNDLDVIDCSFTGRTKQTTEPTCKLYDDRLDGFIEPDFFERKAPEWRQTQKRLTDQIGEYENAAHDYVQEVFAY